MSATIINPNLNTGTSIVDGTLPDGKLSGNIFWVGNLDFEATAHTFRKNGIVYTAPAVNFTLSPSDVALDRIDLFVASTSGEIKVIEGAPSENAAEPELDPLTEIDLRFVIIEAGALEPKGGTKILAYDENVGTPAEWNATDIGIGVTVDATLDPLLGAKHVKFSNYTNRMGFRLESDTVLAVKDLTDITFSVKNEVGAIEAFAIHLYNGSQRLGSAFVFNNQHGYQNTGVTDYQTVKVPYEAFEVIESNFDAIEIIALGEGTPGNLSHVDNVVLTTGLTVLNGKDFLSEFIDDIGATEKEIFKVTNKAQIVNKDLDPAIKVYQIMVNLDLIATDRIRLALDQVIMGLGADITSINTTEPNSVIFEGLNCKNVNIRNINLSAGGAGSRAFNVKDSNGFHEFRLTGVNFIGSTSGGDVDGFRQWFSKDLGVYNGLNGFRLNGDWSGMYFQESNAFGFDAGGTFFEQGTDLTFSGRLIIQSNFSFQAGAVFMDFQPDVFLESESLQLVNCVAKIDGVKDDNNGALLIPNISPNDPKCLWSGNSGIPNTAIEKIVIDEDVSGVYNIDWLNDTYDLTMTGDTVFTESNTPASGRRSKTLNITLTGAFKPTFPAGWEINRIGTYKGTDLNEISSKYVKDGVYFVRISNSLTVYPAPDISDISPISIQPNSNDVDVIINGSFFTPETIVDIEGQTVTNIDFVNSSRLIVRINTANDNDFVPIRISNGTEVEYPTLLAVRLGIVTPLRQADITDQGANTDFSEEGKITITNSDSGTSNWLNVPNTDDFQIHYQFALSPFNTAPGSNGSHETITLYNGATKILSFGIIGHYPELRLQQFNPNSQILRSGPYPRLVDESPSRLIRVVKEGDTFGFRNDLNQPIGPTIDRVFDSGTIDIRISSRQANLTGVAYIKTN